MFLRPSLSKNLIHIRRSFSTSNSNLIPFNFTNLNSTRSTLLISGLDSVKFLQGLISNDIKKLNPGEQQERLLFCAMLKADGRMLYDIFVSSASTSTEPSTIPSYYLDHSSTSTTALRTYLKRHILRSKVKLSKNLTEDRTIFVAWKSNDPNTTEEELKEGLNWLEENKIGKDVRCEEIGWRWSSDNSNPLTPPPSLFKPVPSTHYELHRLSLAIPENPTSWPLLPLEGNLDLMNGVDYKKGCYVGQELTARTHHRGVVRKRGVGLRFWREGDEIPTSLLPNASAYIPSSTQESTKLPSPQSTLIQFTPYTSSSTAPTSTRTPRPSGKIGAVLSLSNDLNDESNVEGGKEVVIGFGSVRLEHIKPDSIFLVKEPEAVSPIESESFSSNTEEGKEAAVKGEAVDEDKRRWLAKAFIPNWLDLKIKEDDARQENNQ